MGSWARSKQITRMCFDVIKADKEMLLFPLLAGIFSIAFSLAMLFPTIIVHILRHEHVVFEPLHYVLTFVTYLGLAFVATFFNVCVVYTTKVRLEGGDATFGQSIGFAFSRIHLIFAWSLVAATVGMILHTLDRMGRGAGGVGKVLLAILRGLLGAAWSLITIFVVPAMVYEGLGPFAAIKRSIETLKATWGESLIRYYGMGFVQFVILLPALLAIVGIIPAMSRGVPPEIGLGVLVLAFVYMMAVILVFNVANTVFNTALFVYAGQGRAPQGFDREVMQGAFQTKG
jgi:hypothetical protein